MNAQALASVLGPVYLVLGLSVLLYAKQWQKLLAKWADSHFELFTLMLLMTAAGLISIYMYNVWEWNVWLIVTLSGWGMFLKGVFYILAPGSLIKGVLNLGKKLPILYFGGLAAVVLGGVLGYYAYLV